MFDRLKVLWLGFWSTLLGHGEKHHAIVAQGAIEQHKQHLKSVREALTNLIFQKKKLGDQLGGLDHELLELKADVQQAASTGRDELALNLIARLEAAQDEANFLRDQVQTIEKDVVVARETEQQLIKEIGQAEQMLGTLTSRYQALKVRKAMQSELQALSRTVPGNASKLRQPLADQIHRLEAEMETLQMKRESWEKEWQTMRDQRSKNRHQAMLDQLKEKMGQKVRAPVTINVPAPVS